MDSQPLNWVIGGGVYLLLFALVWVRRLSNFAILFMISDIIIIEVLLMFTVYLIVTHMSWRHLSLFPSSYTQPAYLLGILAFAFEGYGLVIPARNQIKDPGKYGCLLNCTLGSVGLFYLLFGLVTSTHEDKVGNVLTFEILTKVFNIYDAVAYGLSIAFMACLIPSYVLSLYPPLKILELRLCPRMGRLHIKNLMRSVIVLLTAVVAIVAHEDYIKVVAYSGCILCAILILLIPACAHLKLIASTSSQKSVDILLIVLGLLLLLGCPTLLTISLFP
jgi:hypothetical protein